MNGIANAAGKSILHLRQRSVWEAADSGILLWRDCFLYLIPFFAIPFWACAIFIHFIAGFNLMLSCFILWWLKPFFDRLILHVVSRRFFSRDNDKTNSTKLRKGILESILRGLLGDLLWRRLSPFRASRMPIRVLEKLKGKRYKERKKALALGGLNFCIIISAICILLELMLLTGEIGFISIFLQLFSANSLILLISEIEYFWIIFYILFSFNYILSESFYVCMCFGLYINSRIEVEGWDLQLQFQTFKNSSTKAKIIPKKVLFTGIIISIIFFSSINLTYADTTTTEKDITDGPASAFPDNFPSPSLDQISTLEEILSSEDFGGTRERWGLRFKYAEEIFSTELERNDWTDFFQRLLNYFIRFIAVCLIITFIVFIILCFRKYILRSKNNKSKKLKRHKKNYILHDESPGFYFNKAKNTYAEGRIKEAWSLCLAGYLASYKMYYSITFPIDATEYGCLSILNKENPKIADVFNDFIKCWIPLAYGESLPREGEFENVMERGLYIGQLKEMLT